MSNVKDVRIKPIKIMLDGEEHSLCYDLNAFAELEEKYGTVEKALQAMEKGNFRAVRTFIWAGMLREDENITERKVGSLITPGQLEDLAAKIGEALEQASPKAKPNPNPNHPAV